MKRMILLAALAAPLLTVSPDIAEAGKIQRACMKSDRDAANRQLCRCIEKAARRTLRSADMSLAASFFANPHRSQEIRQSDRQSHENFWQRYKKFGQYAQQSCS